MLYLTFLLMIMETIVQPCKAQKSQGEKNKVLLILFKNYYPRNMLSNLATARRLPIDE